MTGRAPMPAAIRFPVAPRDVRPSRVARRLDMTEAEFDRVKDRLFLRAFPHPDPDTGHYDLVAVDAWLDRRSGLTTIPDSRQALVSMREKLDAWTPEAGRNRKA